MAPSDPTAGIHFPGGSRTTDATNIHAKPIDKGAGCGTVVGYDVGVVASGADTTTATGDK